MQDNIDKIIKNALEVDKDIKVKDLKSIITQIKKSLENNKEVILQANNIDIKNHNGYLLDFDIINNIFSNLEKETILYGDITLEEKDSEKNLIYGKQIMDIGNVVVINDGNPYVIIEMAIRNILALNTTIFSNNGFMFGTNKLLIQIIESVLEKFNVSKYLIQIYVSETFDELLSNFANIDLVVCIGNHSLQNMILNKSKNKTIVSGYENFDLYVEDTSHLDFLNKITNTGLNIQVYINNNTRLDYENAIKVNDIYEAIAQLNYNGSRYSSAIFTASSENASIFIRQVKSKYVTVNASPTIERIMDIKQTDLINEKIVIYPLGFKFNKTINININE